MATVPATLYQKYITPVLKRIGPPCKLIKPECFVCFCVEQVFLYPWMCHTSWFELHRTQDERFSAPLIFSIISLEVTFLLCQTNRGGSTVILWYFEVKVLSYKANIQEIHKILFFSVFQSVRCMLGSTRLCVHECFMVMVI